MKIKSNKVFKILAIALCFFMVFEQSGFAQIAGQLDISGHLAAFSNSLVQDKFRPLHLRYLQYDPQLSNFKLLLDKGNSKKLSNSFVEESTKTLLQYFLVGVSLPNDAFWVNLRPDSPDNVIDPLLGQTDVGKILLEADVQLKKDTAKFTSPETPEGKEYWDKLYDKAGEIFGSQNVTIPTLTRPWIVPDEIILRETSDNAYVYKATLKVMLEDDYLKGSAVYNFDDPRLKELNTYASSVLREKIIPKLTQEVNASKKYAALRQVYYSLILAQWFKQRFNGKGGRYASLINKQNLDGLISKSSWSKNTYFQQYQKSFKDGEYNFKVPMSTPSGQVIRSYFSGGIKIPNNIISRPGLNMVLDGGGTSASIIGNPLRNFFTERTGIEINYNGSVEVSKSSTTQSPAAVLAYTAEANKAEAPRKNGNMSGLVLRGGERERVSLVKEMTEAIREGDIIKFLAALESFKYNVEHSSPRVDQKLFIKDMDERLDLMLKSVTNLEDLLRLLDKAKDIENTNIILVTLAQRWIRNPKFNTENEAGRLDLARINELLNQVSRKKGMEYLEEYLELAKYIKESVNIEITGYIPQELIKDVKRALRWLPSELTKKIRIPIEFRLEGLEFGVGGKVTTATISPIKVDADQLSPGEHDFFLTIWHEAMHKLSFSSNHENLPILSVDSWKQIANAAGFYGAFVNGKLVPLDQLTEEYKEFRSISYGDWVYKEGDKLVAYFADQGQFNKAQNNSKYRDADVKIKMFSQGEYWKTTPFETVAEVGAGYIMDSEMAYQEAGGRGKVAMLLAEIFFIVDGDNGRQRYVFDYSNKNKKLEAVSRNMVEEKKRVVPSKKAETNKANAEAILEAENRGSRNPFIYKGYYDLFGYITSEGEMKFSDGTEEGTGEQFIIRVSLFNQNEEKYAFEDEESGLSEELKRVIKDSVELANNTINPKTGSLGKDFSASSVTPHDVPTQVGPADVNLVAGEQPISIEQNVSSFLQFLVEDPGTRAILQTLGINQLGLVNSGTKFETGILEGSLIESGVHNGMTTYRMAVSLDAPASAVFHEILHAVWRNNPGIRDHWRMKGWGNIKTRDRGQLSEELKSEEAFCDLFEWEMFVGGGIDAKVSVEAEGEHLTREARAHKLKELQKFFQDVIDLYPNLKLSQLTELLKAEEFNYLRSTAALSGGMAEGGGVDRNTLNVWIQNGNIDALVAHVNRGLQGKSDDRIIADVTLIINGLKDDGKRQEFVNKLPGKLRAMVNVSIGGADGIAVYSGQAGITEEIVHNDKYIEAAFSQPLVTVGLATCCALAIIDHKNQRHFLAHITSGAGEDVQNTLSQLKAIDLNGKETKIYIMKGDGDISKSHSIILGALHALGVKEDKIEEQELKNKDVRLSGIVLYDGKLYIPRKDDNKGGLIYDDKYYGGGTPIASVNLSKIDILHTISGGSGEWEDIGNNLNLDNAFMRAAEKFNITINGLDYEIEPLKGGSVWKITSLKTGRKAVLKRVQSNQETGIHKELESAGVRVPKVFYSNSRVMIMEYLEGTQISHDSKSLQQLYDLFIENNVNKDKFIADVHTIDRLGKSHNDLRDFCNMFIVNDEVVFIDFGVATERKERDVTFTAQQLIDTLSWWEIVAKHEGVKAAVIQFAEKLRQQLGEQSHLMEADGTKEGQSRRLLNEIKNDTDLFAQLENGTKEPFKLKNLPHEIEPLILGFETDKIWKVTNTNTKEVFVLKRTRFSSGEGSLQEVLLARGMNVPKIYARNKEFIIMEYFQNSEDISEILVKSTKSVDKLIELHKIFERIKDSGEAKFIKDLEILRDSGVTHNDVKGFRNLLLTGNQIFFIDFEASISKEDREDLMLSSFEPSAHNVLADSLEQWINEANNAKNQGTQSSEGSDAIRFAGRLKDELRNIGDDEKGITGSEEKPITVTIYRREDTSQILENIYEHKNEVSLDKLLKEIVDFGNPSDISLEIYNEKGKRIRVSNQIDNFINLKEQIMPGYHVTIRYALPKVKINYNHKKLLDKEIASKTLKEIFDRDADIFGEMVDNVHIRIQNEAKNRKIVVTKRNGKFYDESGSSLEEDINLVEGDIIDVLLINPEEEKASTSMGNEWKVEDIGWEELSRRPELAEGGFLGTQIANILFNVEKSGGTIKVLMLNDNIKAILRYASGKNSIIIHEIVAREKGDPEKLANAGTELISKLLTENRGIDIEVPSIVSTEGYKLFDKFGFDMGKELDANGELEGSTSAKLSRKDVGGIDFRALPITTQPMTLAGAGGRITPGTINITNVNLDKEWQEIESMLNAGIKPSLERIREYLVVSCKDANCQAKIDQVLSGLADILRMEEESSFKTETELKAILMLLESNKSAEQLGTELLKISIMPLEPMKM